MIIKCINATNPKLLGITSVDSDVLRKLPILFCLHRVLGEILGYNMAITSVVCMLHESLWFGCNLFKTIIRLGLPMINWSVFKRSFKVEIAKKILMPFVLRMASNKYVIYRHVFQLYFLELWGCASKSNKLIMQRSQSKILRAIANAQMLLYIQASTLLT
jgi:hypothetical protein